MSEQWQFLGEENLHMTPYIWPPVKAVRLYGCCVGLVEVQPGYFRLTPILGPSKHGVRFARLVLNLYPIKLMYLSRNWSREELYHSLVLAYGERWMDSAGFEGSYIPLDSVSYSVKSFG